MTRQVECHLDRRKNRGTTIAASVNSARDITHTHNPLRAYLPPFSSRATPFQGLPTSSSGQGGPTSSSYSEDKL